MKTDPRIRQLAESHLRIAEQDTTPRTWTDLPETEQNRRLWEAETWLRAAVEAHIAPAAERPSDKHDAVWLDDEGFLWGEYQTSPPTPLEEAAILRLVWASEQCSSKRELEDQGVEFRLIGWSQ